MPKQSSLAQHYETIGSRYDRQYKKLFGKNREKTVQIIAQMIMKLSSSPKKIVDIGGGTGTTIELLKDLIGPQHTFILVEPYRSMYDQAMLKKNKPDLLIPVSAQEFVQNSQYINSIDVIIAQEMIAHVENPKTFFENVHRVLKKNGCMIIITRPLEVEFPFGTHGKKVWRESYSMDPSKISTTLRGIGFRVKEELYSFPIKIDKSIWKEMIGEKPYFSMYASFSPQQKEMELREVEEMEDILEFSDKLMFIFAEKT